MLIGTLLDAGCGERDYLITYTSSGKIIDTLRVFGEGTLVAPNENNKEGEYYSIESNIYKDSISILRAETTGPIIREQKKRKIWKRFHQRTYQINTNGKFFVIYKKDWEAYYYFKH